ncbi:MAG: hypothetical protein QOH06_732 [Acidobacteriota bacterium]|jgi:hypothetical protein|nr:hypothetical protein [Acidobacteriota bacterium]
MPEAGSLSPRLTIFTAGVYPDVLRIWYACIRRSFPAADVAVEIFDDSGCGALLPEWFPGATVLGPGPGRRDYQEAYNDALARAATPYLAFVDCDVFWLSRDLWPWLAGELAHPGVAAVACVSRHDRRSHGTFAVVFKTEVYREVLAGLPGGFSPAITGLDLAVERSQWRWSDTADLATEAVLASGREIRLLHLDERGDLVVFDSITLIRRLVEIVGAEAYAARQGGGRLFWHGCAGNLVLGRLHDRLFPEGPAYGFQSSWLLLLRQLGRRGPKKALWRLRYAARLRAAARRIEAYLEPAPRRRGVQRNPSARPPAQVLRPGECHVEQRFGSATVNRGAVLMSCEWDGGLFEAGVMLGGVFRSGEFRGGTFSGGVFAGTWTGGSWGGGYDRNGRYRPRNAPPVPAAPESSPDPA